VIGCRLLKHLDKQRVLCDSILTSIRCVEKPLAPAVPVRRPSRRVPGAFDGMTTSRGKHDKTLLLRLLQPIQTTKIVII